MNTHSILKYAFLHAVGGALYVAGIVWFVTTVGKLIGPEGGFIGGITFLLVFVISAAIMGSIILLRPIFWYFAGKKHEAVKLLVATIAFLLLIAVGVIFFILSR